MVYLGLSILKMSKTVIFGMIKWNQNKNKINYAT